MQIQLTSEITEPYTTMSVISGLFYTSYSPVVSQDAAILARIFHGTRIGKYYCKNMKHRINNIMYVCRLCPLTLSYSYNP